MIKRLNPFILSEQQEEDGSIAEWAFQSHYWIEKMAGCFVCKWCEAVHYPSTYGITKDFPLCPKNYAVMKLIEDFLQTLKEENKNDE